MAQMTKSSVLWTILGIVSLLFVLNQWMSREINHPVPILQSPAAAVSEPMETVQPTQPLPLPLNMEESPETPVQAKASKAASPQVGEKVNEPIYEPPSQDVILVE